MTARHLDEGTIQAYLDGELAAEAAGAAEAHFARCAACAESLDAARDETGLFAAAFAPDEGVAVPTEVLRARISAAVAWLEDAAPAGGAAPVRGMLRESFFGPLRRLFAFAPQRAAGFAGALAVLVFAVVIFSVVGRRPAPDASGGQLARADATPTPVLGGPPPAIRPSTGPAEVAAVTPGEGVRAPERLAGSGVRGPAAVVTASAERSGGARARTGAAGEAAKPPAAEAGGEALLPGEENYRQAIASLSKAVELGGDAVMSPKARFDYERNLALLDSAINETRRVALRDPKDKEAAAFLMSAYQSKVDLLTTVADQAQVAAIGR
ncbi:MAG TPA: zf-HC2 domain-containing protein [Pyrinomonadaceae bacterium]|nr:zf-HC2 domain-containing protein [Pyrinomonadaceae bacterium]